MMSFTSSSFISNNIVLINYPPIVMKGELTSSPSSLHTLSPRHHIMTIISSQVARIFLSVFIGLNIQYRVSPSKVFLVVWGQYTLL